METPPNEDRQRDERRAITAGDDVGRGRQFADVEFDLAHHAPIGRDLRLDVDEFRLNSLDRDRPGFDRGRLRIVRDRKGETQRRFGHRMFPTYGWPAGRRPSVLFRPYVAAA